MQLVTDLDSVDVQTFQFKLQRKIQVFESNVDVQRKQLSLVASASRFGLLFVGTPDKSFHVFQINDIIEGNEEKCQRRVVSLPSVPLHISLNCDNELLSVVINKNDSLVAVIYETRSFNQNVPRIKNEIRLVGSSDSNLCSLVWNPCLPDSLAVCLSDGSLSVFQCKPDSIELQSKPTNARCLSWSPKGKQIVTGNADGTLNQYKPDLTLVKNIPAPQLFENAPCQVLAIHWISNFQFNVVYNNAAEPENTANVTIVNTPKSGTNNCVNYEDICYSTGSRENQFYLLHLSQWGVIITSSANSMEIGVLGTKDQNVWQQWILIDEARAELPLTASKQENYPVGIAFDTASTTQLPWGDAMILPFMPILHILSHTGVLVSFFTLNLEQTAPNLCQTPELIKIPPNLMITNSSSVTATPAAVEKPAPVQDFSFAINPNTATSTPTLPKSDRIAVGLNNMVSNNLFGSVGSVKPNSAVQFSEPSSLLKLNTNPINETPQETVQEKFKLPPNLTTIPATIQDFQKPIPKELPKIDNFAIDNKTTPESPVIPNSALEEMLVKEVNNFQIEQYELFLRCFRINTEIGNDDEMRRIANILSTKQADPLLEMWSDQDLKRQLMALKQDLINTCAFIAEAKLQPGISEIEQLVQLDPISAGKMSSIRLNSYYIESQLKQVNQVLIEQKNTMGYFDAKTSRHIIKKRVNAEDQMKIPTLDKIYQPILKQSDILAKQQFLVSMLEKRMASLNLYDKQKQLNSQLITKSLNLSNSISAMTNKFSDVSFSDDALLKKTPAQQKNLKEKNDALRKLLTNYKTVKIKPPKVEATSMIQMFQDWEVEKAKKEKVKAALKAQELKKETKDTFTFVKPDDKFVPVKSTNEHVTTNPVPVSNSMANISSFVPNIKNITASVPAKPINTDKVETKPKEDSVPKAFPIGKPNTDSGLSSFKINENKATIPTIAAPAFATFNVKTTAPTFVPPAAQSFPTISKAPVIQPTISAPPIAKPEKVAEAQPVQAFSNFTLNTKAVSTASNVSAASTQPFSFSFVPPKSSDFTFTPPKPVEKKAPEPAAAPIAKTTFVAAAVSTAPPNVNLFSMNNIFGANQPKSVPVSPIVATSAVVSIANPQTSFVSVGESTGSLTIAPSSITPAASSAIKTALENTPSLTITPIPSPTITEKPVKTEELSMTSLNVTIGEEKKVETVDPVLKPKEEAESTEKQEAKPPAFSFNLSPKTTPATTIAQPVATTSQISIFGNSAPAASTVATTFNGFSKPTFGTPTTSFSTNIFGSPPPANTCASSLFGAANAAIDSSVTSLFGNTTISTPASSFGNTNTTSGGSMFTGGSVFGGRTSFGQANEPGFQGNSTFGQPQQTGSIFGGSAFGSGFGTTAQTPSVFGQAAQSSSLFGDTSSNQGNIFGAKSSFGSPATTSAAPQSSIFGAPAQSTSVFGGASGFGSKPMFGQPAAFGSPTGFGAFSAGDQPSVAQTGFGSPSSFGSPNSTGLFGESPKFGTTATFGTPATFGGSTSPFGNKFGSPSGFNNATPQSSTFESLANQNSLSFGNLAQQSPQQPSPPPSFQASPSFSNWR